MPKISVITVCYNEAANIKATLDSIVNQTFRDFELIVVDGGSTDGTKEIIQQYANRITWWCSEADRGIYNAMNKGVTHASGEYVIFMNGGDRFHNIKVMENVFSENVTADIIEGHTIGSNGERIDLEYDDLGKKLLADGICHQSTFIRRQLLINHPYSEQYKLAADWRFWIQTLLCEGRTHQYVDIIVAIFDLNGLTFSNLDRIMEERKVILQEVLPLSSLAHLTVVLTEYQEMTHDTVVDYARYLSMHSRGGYNIVRKIAKRIVRIIRKREDGKKS